MAIGASEEGGPGAAVGESVGRLLLLFGVFTALILAVYRGALQGEFVSDDVGYFQSNPFTRELSVENFISIIDPWARG